METTQVEVDAREGDRNNSSIKNLLAICYLRCSDQTRNGRLPRIYRSYMVPASRSVYKVKYNALIHSSIGYQNVSVFVSIRHLTFLLSTSECRTLANLKRFLGIE